MKKILHILKTIINVSDKGILQHASSLSFYSVLNIIPILSLSFFVFAHMPSFKEQSSQLNNFIFSLILPNQEANSINYIEQFLQNSTKLDVAGIIAMIFALFMFFNAYENTISHISNTPKKGFFSSLSTYWSLITLAPLGLLTSFYLSYKIQKYIDAIGLKFNFLGILPFLIIWALFFVCFHISINKHLNPKIIALVSFLVALVWSIFKSLFVFYISLNKVYTSIYGSFSAVLFFFIWLYFSWIIYLNGVRISSLLNTDNSKAKSTK